MDKEKSKKIALTLNMDIYNLLEKSADNNNLKIATRATQIIAEQLKKEFLGSEKTEYQENNFTNTNIEKSDGSVKINKRFKIES